MALIAYCAGGTIFVLLGALHAFYTWLDGKDPRRLVPGDPETMAAMRSSPLRLSRGATTVWRAWTGFNYSHSLGLVWFGASCAVLAFGVKLYPIPDHALILPVLVGATYTGLAIRYWFKIPAIGAGLATLLLLLGA